MIKFNKKAWIQPLIDMNIKLRQKARNNFEKDFFKLWNNKLILKTQFKFKISMIRSNLCDYSNAYMLVREL